MFFLFLWFIIYVLLYANRALDSEVIVAYEKKRLSLDSFFLCVYKSGKQSKSPVYLAKASCK